MAQFSRSLLDRTLETLEAISISPVAENTIRAHRGRKFLLFGYADTRDDVCSHGLRKLDRRHSHSARGPIDEHEVARTDFTDDLQGVIGGEEIATDVRALRERNIVRGLPDGPGIDRYDLGQRARTHLPDDAVALP